MKQIAKMYLLLLASALTVMSMNIGAMETEEVVEAQGTELGNSKFNKPLSTSAKKRLAKERRNSFKQASGNQPVETQPEPVMVQPVETPAASFEPSSSNIKIVSPITEQASQAPMTEQKDSPVIDATTPVVSQEVVVEKVPASQPTLDMATKLAGEKQKERKVAKEKAVWSIFKNQESTESTPAAVVKDVSMLVVTEKITTPVQNAPVETQDVFALARSIDAAQESQQEQLIVTTPVVVAVDNAGNPTEATPAVKKTSPLQGVKNILNSGKNAVNSGLGKVKGAFSRKNSKESTQEDVIEIGNPTNPVHVNHNGVSIETPMQPATKQTTVVVNGQPVPMVTPQAPASTNDGKQEDTDEKTPAPSDVPAPKVESTSSMSRTTKGIIGVGLLGAVIGTAVYVDTTMPKSKANTRTWLRDEMFNRLSNGNYAGALVLVQEQKVFSFLSPRELNQVRRFVEAAIVAQKGLEAQIDTNLVYQHRSEIGVAGLASFGLSVVCKAIAQKRAPSVFNKLSWVTGVPAALAATTAFYGFWEQSKRNAIPTNNQCLLTILDLLPKDAAEAA